MKLLRSTENKITKDKNGENVPYGKGSWKFPMEIL